MYYHVYIIMEGGPDWAENDFTKNDLEKRILEPYYKGKLFVSSGYTVDPQKIKRIQISQTVTSSKDILPIIRARDARSSVLAVTSSEFKVYNYGEDVTKQFITKPAGVLGRSFLSKVSIPHNFFKSTGGKIIISIIVTLLVYFILGTFIYSSSVMFYGSFEDEFDINPFFPEEELTYSVQNKAPLTLPMVNSYFLFQVVINDMPSTNTYAFTPSRGGIKNFTDNIFDLGLIKPGQTYYGSFFLQLTEENATFTTDIYYHIFRIFKYKVVSKSYYLEYNGNSKYTIYLEP